MPRHHRLAEILKKKKLSKYKFAHLIGMKYGNVFRFFEEDYDPKVSMLKRWAQALKIRVCDLIKE